MSKRIITNSIATSSAGIANIVMIFIISPVFVHAVGNSLYGMWEILLSIFGYLGVLDLGIKPAIVKFVAQHRALNARSELKQLYINSVIFFGILGVIICIFFLVFPFASIFFPTSHGYERSVLQQISILFGISVLFELPSAVLGGFLFGIQRHAIVSAIQTVIAIIGNIIIYIGLKCGFGLVLVAEMRIVTNLFVSLALYQLLRKSEIRYAINYRFSNLSKASFKELVSFGIKNMVIMISGRLEKTSIPLVISYFIGVSSVVFYVIPMRLIDYTSSLVDNLTLPFMPLFSEIHALSDQERARNIYFKVTKYVLILIIPLCVGISILGGDFIGIWMGREYGEQSKRLLPFFVIGLAANSLNPFVNRLLVGTGRHGISARWNLISSIANLILSILLVGKYGLAGIAFSCCLACWFRSVLLTKATAEYLSITQIQFYRKTVLPLMVTMILMVVYCRLMLQALPPTSYLNLAIVFVSGFFVYIIPTVFTNIERDDLHIFLGRKLAVKEAQ